MNSAVNQAHGQRDDVDDVLVAFWEWLRLQEARWRDGPDRKEFHFSPNIASGDPFLDAHRRPAVLQRLSIAWRVLRTVSWGFLFTVIVSAAVAWQSSDDTTKDLVRRWVDEVAGLGTVVHDEAPASAGAAIEPPSNTTDAAPNRVQLFCKQHLLIRPRSLQRPNCLLGSNIGSRLWETILRSCTVSSRRWLPGRSKWPRTLQRCRPPNRI